jgi:hypothetical protein
MAFGESCGKTSAAAALRIKMLHHPIVVPANAPVAGLTG